MPAYPCPGVLAVARSIASERQGHKLPLRPSFCSRPVGIKPSWLPYNLIFNCGAKKMLSLSRRIGETIVIGDDVTIKVLRIKGNQIHLGINAPKDTSVHRSEIYELIQNGKKLASNRKIGDETDPRGEN